MAAKSKATTKNATSKRITFKSAEIEVKDLLLDPNNYRFLDNVAFKKKIKTKFHVPAVQEVTLRLLEKDKRYQLAELKKSILANGYVPMERIIVVPYKYSRGRFLVVEGNRRVATLKSLIEEGEEGVRELTPEQIASFSKIPCAILHAPEGGLAHAERVIMGIRHIAGPKEWGAYQQAQLVSEMHDIEGEDFNSIAEHLGISAIEASRRYRAMRALKGMENDELYSESSSPQFYRLFHELVSLPEVRRRFGWNDEEIEFSDIDKAREFYELIAPTVGDEPKLKTYSDVRKLKLIVGYSKAEAALLDPDQPFSEALKIASNAAAQEDAGELALSELLGDLRAQVKSVRVTELQNVTKQDLTAVKHLLTALETLKNAIERLLDGDGD